MVGSTGAQTTEPVDNNKLYHKAVADPGYYDGTKSKFQDWWRNMQLWLSGYSDMSGTAKIVAVLSRLTTGDAVDWARAKKTEIIDSDVAFTWEAFKLDLVERFDDPTRKMQALTSIHNFRQEKISVQTYIDKFTILKSTSALGDAEALYLFKRGLHPSVSLAAYSSDRAIPDGYNDFVKLIKDIGRNMENRRGLLEGARVLGSSNANPTHSNLDRRTGTGMTYGGSGQPMEIGAMRPVRCYNCGKGGHMAKECKESKRVPGSCFYCEKAGHLAKDCRKKKADRERTPTVKKTTADISPGEAPEEDMAEEINDEDFADFTEGSS
jgi:hypothetical protein